MGAARGLVCGMVVVRQVLPLSRPVAPRHRLLPIDATLALTPACSPPYRTLRDCSVAKVSSLFRARSTKWRAMSASADSEAAEEKMPARLAQTTERYLSASPADPAEADEPVPRISVDHVVLNFARSGGAGGQNVNKVNTKVDMRFNVELAEWLPDRVRQKLIETEKNRINGEGELVVTSSRTRTQKGNIDDALAKMQGILDAAGYVPPPPSEEKKKKIKKLAKIENEKRLQNKKKSSVKKTDRRNKGSWD